LSSAALLFVLMINPSLGGYTAYMKLKYKKDFGIAIRHLGMYSVVVGIGIVIFTLLKDFLIQLIISDFL